MMEPGDPDALVKVDAVTSCSRVGPVQPAKGVTLSVKCLAH